MQLSQFAKNRCLSWVLNWKVFYKLTHTQTNSEAGGERVCVMLLLVFTSTIIFFFCKTCFIGTHILANIRKHNTHKWYTEAHTEMHSDVACCFCMKVHNSKPSYPYLAYFSLAERHHRQRTGMAVTTVPFLKLLYPPGSHHCSQAKQENNKETKEAALPWLGFVPVSRGRQPQWGRPELRCPWRRCGVTSQQPRPVPDPACGCGLCRCSRTPLHSSLILAGAFSLGNLQTAAGRRRWTLWPSCAGASWLPWSWSRVQHPSHPNSLRSLPFNSTASWLAAIRLSKRHFCASQTSGCAFCFLHVLPQYIVVGTLPLTSVRAREAVLRTWLELSVSETSPLAGLQFCPQISSLSHTAHLRIHKVLGAPCQQPSGARHQSGLAAGPGSGSLAEKSSTPLSVSFLWLSRSAWKFIWAVGTPSWRFLVLFFLKK